MSKRPSNGSLPPAKKLAPIFTSGPALASVGMFDKAAPPSLIHYYTSSSIISDDAPDKPVELVLYDLDGTLIKPKSGNKFPKDAHDWVWWHDCVPGRLRDDIRSGKHVVILSNQSKVRKSFKEKIPLIAKKIDKVPFRLLAAAEHNQFRKPHTGMYDFVVKLYQDKGWEVDHDKSVYVGDAAGRHGDHSNTDYTMALNAGLRFLTPEEHFLGKPAKYPNPPASFRPGKDCPTDLPFVTPSSSPIAGDEKEMVLFVGAPASGKSSFYRRFFQPKSYVHINQDTLVTRDKCLKAAREALEEGKAVVIDNTNRDKKTRKIWVDLAKEMKVPVRLFLFTVPPKLLIHNEIYRSLYPPPDDPPHKHVPMGAITTYQRDYEAPTTAEGFAEIRNVNFVWQGDDAQRKLWDRYLLYKE